MSVLYVTYLPCFLVFGLIDDTISALANDAFDLVFIHT
jgi:hypothetical protein